MLYCTHLVMNLLVFVQVHPLEKGFLTLITFEGFVLWVSMATKMLPQRALVSESPVTNLTFVRFLSCIIDKKYTLLCDVVSEKVPYFNKQCHPRSAVFTLLR